MAPLDIEHVGSTRMPATEIEAVIQQSSPFILQVPLPSINFSQSYLDVISDYLDASFLAEELVNHADTMQVEKIWGIKYHPVYHFTIIPKNSSEVAQKIYDLSILFGYDGDDAEDEHMWWREKVIEYGETLDEREFSYPEIIDDFYANLVNGAYYELDSEHDNFLENEFKKYPERRFGFWRTPHSGKFGSDCYVSVDAWIAPLNVDIHQMIEAISGQEYQVNFEPVEPLFFNHIAYLLNSEQIVFLPFGHFMKAKSCTAMAINPDEFGIDYHWLDKVYTFSPSHDAISKRYTTFMPYVPERYKYFLSDFGNLILIQDEAFSYLLFDSRNLDDKERIELASSLSDVFMEINNLSGIRIDVSCPWDLINDEQFEQLCYDVIYYNPKFDNSTIRKMGKSRSRDGGRDIEVFTRSRPGYEPEKFIFQCKLIKPGSSLTSSKVVGITDVIDQYGASGYGVMTSGVIDSTLFDKLDGIKRNRGIYIDHWSVYELERFLAKHLNIKERHFGIFNVN